MAPKLTKEQRREINRINGKKGGGKKGKKSAKTLEREKVQEAMRQQIWRIADKLIQAQTVVAFGTYKMIRPFIGEDGLPHTETIRDMDDMQRLIDTGVLGKDYLIVVGSEPDHKAAANLLDRGLGKPVETVDFGNKDDEPFIINFGK